MRGRVAGHRAGRIGIAGLLTGTACCLLAAGLYAGQDGLPAYPASRWITDTNGKPLRLLLGPGDQRCEPVPFSRTGTWAAKALVAAEDKRFFRHHGVDVAAVARATAQNLSSGRVVSGASTISTQVIRLTHPRSRTLLTKLKETVSAMKMELGVTKNDILEQYLNRAPFGGNLIGVQAASRRYFGRDAADLSLGEAALLMGLPQGPSRMRPDRHPLRALRRRNYVLERMEACGFIDEAQRQAALRAPVALVLDPPLFRAPHFCNLILSKRSAADEDVFVRSTLDLDIQRMVDDALGRHARQLRFEGVHGGAIVVIDVGAGALRALAGSPDYNDLAHQGRVNCAYRLRSPGSALKPFVYAMAMERGLLTPATVLRDTPVKFAEYEPRNFDGDFSGAVSARQALSRSLNVPALHVTEWVGLSALIQRLRRVGLNGIDKPASHYGLSLVLGTAEVRLLNLANAYAALARRGAYSDLRVLEQDPVTQGRRAFSPSAAYLVTEMLSQKEMAAAWVGHGAADALPRVALKTGTSNGFRDAWAIAYNPEYVVGVWLGNPDGAASAALVGREVAAPLAYQVMRRLYPNGDAPWFERPAGVGEREVCTASGQRPGVNCAAVTTDLYVRGISRSDRCLTCGRAESQATARPPRALLTSLSITAPGDGTEYKLLEAMAGGEQVLLLRAEGDAAEVFWFIDDRLFAQESAGATVAWPLRRGAHRIVCSDAKGKSDVVSIVVE